METRKINRPSKPVLSQTENNTTLWLGHLSSDNNDHLAGQTFSCPSEGLLNNIQVYTSTVTQPGEVQLTLHEFNCQTREWGPAIARAGKVIEKSDEDRWTRFELEPLMLKKNSCYGFRLKTNNAFLGLGEAVTNAQRPFTFGPSWNSDGLNEHGEYFNYFSLAFKVEMCA
jgi:hypothetical protein